MRELKEINEGNNVKDENHEIVVVTKWIRRMDGRT